MAHEGQESSRPLSENYELVGLRGEQALTLFFGELQLESCLVSTGGGGDGGTDLRITFPKHGTFDVDVKTARKPFYLPIEEGKAKARTIYVLAKFIDLETPAELIGWEWGVNVLKAPIKDLGYGIRSHCIPAEDLRPMSELRDALKEK